MKPKTKIQKEVARLSANLRPISATQIDWAYRHCVEPVSYTHLFRPHIFKGIQQAERVIDTRYVGYEMIAVVTLSQQGVCFIIGQFEGGGQFMGISVLANLLEILYTDWDK